MKFKYLEVGATFKYGYKMYPVIKLSDDWEDLQNVHKDLPDGFKGNVEYRGRKNLAFGPDVQVVAIKLEEGGEYREIVNPDDEVFCDRIFHVSLAQIASAAIVYADNAQEAVDAFADHAEEMGWEGLFLEMKDIKSENNPDGDYTEEEICYVGNHCRPVLDHEIYVVAV